MKICRKLNNKYSRETEMQTNNKWNNNMPQTKLQMRNQTKLEGENAGYWQQNVFIIINEEIIFVKEKINIENII